MHVFSFICVGERRRVGRETESQEAAPGRSSLYPEFLGRGLLSHPTPDSGSGPSSLPNYLHRSLGFQSLPDVSLLLDFPSFPMPSFPSQLLQAYPPTPVSPPCPHPASGTPFGGRGWYVSSQLPARLSWESWEWGKEAGFICTY